MTKTATARPSSSREVVLRLLLAGALLLGCGILNPGQSSTGRSGSTTHSPTHSPPTPTTAPRPSINVRGTATSNGLQVTAELLCGLWVVLTPHAATYSAQELAAIGNFLSTHTQPLGISPIAVSYDPQHLPVTLEYVPGQLRCTGSYELTNTSSNLIQINKVGFQNARTPAPYTYEYHLLDACLYLKDCGCGGCGASAACPYAADMQLHLNDPSLVLTEIGLSDHGNGVIPIPPGIPDCPNVISLRPGDTVGIEMTFNTPSKTVGSWFRGAPAVNVTTASGTTTLTYPSLVNDLVFAPLDSHELPSPNTCVVQQGNTFVPVTSFATRPDPSKSPDDPFYIPRCV
jgi:hypothetical protein